MRIPRHAQAAHLPAMSEFWIMLRPMKQSRRPCCAAISVTICKRCMDVEKHEIRTRPGAPVMISVRRSRTALSEGVIPAGQCCGVREEGQHALAAVVGQRVQVTDPLVHGGGIELEIPRMDDGAEGRGEGQRSGLNDAVRDVNEFYMERPDIKRPMGVISRSSTTSARPCSASLGGPRPG